MDDEQGVPPQRPASQGSIEEAFNEDSVGFADSPVDLHRQGASPAVVLPHITGRLLLCPSVEPVGTVPRVDGCSQTLASDPRAKSPSIVAVRDRSEGDDEDGLSDDEDMNGGDSVIVTALTARGADLRTGCS